MPGTDENTQARTLLLAAADTIQAGDPLASDLLAGVRASRTRTRRRIRVAVSLGTAATLAGGALAAVVATTATSVQSAYAAVAAAASTTSSQSFAMTWSIRLPADPRYHPSTGTGLFDPARGTGEWTMDGYRSLLAGGWDYLRDPPPYTNSHGKPWSALRSPFMLPYFDLALGTGPLPGRDAGNATPQSLFGLLQAAHAVHQDGQASGPGWTGTRYTFSYSGTGSYSGGTGTVAVDRQGRVRELDLSAKVHDGIIQITVGFADFGVPVHVTPPPASEVRYQN